MNSVTGVRPIVSCRIQMLARRRQNQSMGFTLIEFLVVLGIVGSLAALALPRFTDSDSKLMAQALRLSRDIRHVQAIAMNQGRTLSFNTQSATTYNVTYGGSVITDPATLQPYSVTLDNGITLNAMDIDIDSMGRPVESGNMLTVERLFTLSRNARTATIRLSPITGFTKVLP